MECDDTKKWLKYHKKGIKPSRYKLRSLVYCEKAFGIPVNFKLDGLEVKLIPLSGNKKRISKVVDNFLPAFECEVISETRVHSDINNKDISNALDRILPWLGFDYRLPADFTQWEEYEGNWIVRPGAIVRTGMLVTHPALTKKNIHDLVKNCEVLAGKNSNRAKKSVKIRTKLQEGIRLQRVSYQYSFLSFYNVIEMESDDFASQGVHPSGDPTATELSQLEVLKQSNQRAKVYFLLKAVDNSFNLEKCIALADIRNKLAHSECIIPLKKFWLCKEVSFWAAEQFIIVLSAHEKIPSRD